MKPIKISKIWGFYEKHSWKLGVFILIVLLTGFFIQKVDLNTNYAETYGKIYEVNRIASGIRIGPLFKYKFWFSYEGKKYYGESTKTLKGSNKVGKIFKVKISPNNPKNYEIFFDQEYVEKYTIDKNGNKKIFYLKN